MDRAPNNQQQQSSLFPAARDLRQNAMSGLSRLWRPSQGPNNSSASPRPVGKTFVVPLFLSTSRSSARNNLFAQGALPATTRPSTSTRSDIESAAHDVQGVHSLSVPRDQDETSDMYTGSFGEQASVDNNVGPGSIARNLDDTPTPWGGRNTRSHRSGGRSTHSSGRSRRKHATLSKKSFRDPRVNAKAKICFAFGVTLLVTLVIYLVLAVTGTAKNTMFHVLSVLLILILTGIFCHQLVRMIMLLRRPRRTRHRITHRSRHGQARSHQRSARRQRPSTQVESVDDLDPEKPIPIHIASDIGFGPDVEVIGDQPIQLPPPVYGNTRTSTRMNPNLIHWKNVPPSPLTPPYEEAMNQVPRTMGYRPPSYLSESGMTESIERRTRDVDAALENIHPLERERMRTLTADALEGRGQFH